MQELHAQQRCLRTMGTMYTTLNRRANDEHRCVGCGVTGGPMVKITGGYETEFWHIDCSIRDLSSAAETPHPAGRLHR